MNELVAAYWPHAVSLASGALARHVSPAVCRKAWAGIVSVARAIVAYQDGDKVEAVKDVAGVARQVEADIQRATQRAMAPPPLGPVILPAAIPTGTVKSWDSK